MRPQTASTHMFAALRTPLIVTQSLLFWGPRVISSSIEMSYSSLFVSGRYGSHTSHKIFAAIKPILNLEGIFSPQSTASIEDSINRRRGCPALTVSVDSFRALREPINRLLEAQRKIEDIKSQKAAELEVLKKEIASPEQGIQVSKFRQLTQSLSESREKLYDIEEQVIPTVLSLPAPLEPDVPSLHDDEKVIKSTNLGKLSERPSFKQLDFRQLSYINESIFASLVGPDSMYNLGQIAQLHYSIQDHFGDVLRNNSFTDFTGMDFVKDAVVEATNSKLEKDHLSDPFRVAEGYSVSEESQQIHLVGDSAFESFAAFVSKKKWRVDDDTLERLFSVGTNYYINSDSKITQRATVNSFVLLSDKSGVSSVSQEINQLLDILWSVYSTLEIPVKVTRTPAPLLRLNESSRYDISVYIKSIASWVPAGFIANNLNYVASRLGLENAQTINCMAVDVKPVVMSIVEYSQQSNGKLALPKSIDLFNWRN